MPPTFHLIPHTHWDREWYLPLAAFRSRFVALADDLVDRLDADPSFPPFLLDGQTVLLEDYLTLRPDQADRVARLVREGRISTGPWYVLADEQIPSVESLIRNLLLGARDTLRWGRRMPVLYSPDAFGHPPSLPVLAREFGLRWAVLWRGLDQRLTGGKDLTRWVGPGGSEVLVYHLPRAGYEVGSALLDQGRPLADVWAPLRAELMARAATEQVAVLVGADHHACDPGLATLAERLATLDRAASFRASSLEDFFRAAATELPSAPPLSEIRGELRASAGHGWTLQGAHGSRAPLKRRLSCLELGLTRYAEPLAALTRGHSELAPTLRHAWRELLQCQFHDTISGTVVDEVARAAAVRLDAVEAATREVVRTGLVAVAHHDPDLARSRPADQRPTLLLWNPVPRPRASVTRVGCTFFRRDVLVGPPDGRLTREGRGATAFLLRTPEEVAWPVQVLGVRTSLERLESPRHYPDQDEVDRVEVALLTPELPPLGVALLVPADPEPIATPVLARGSSGAIRNDLLDVSVEAPGTVQLRAPGVRQAWRGLLALEDAPDRGDTYTYWSGRRPRASRPRRRPAARPVLAAAGPFVAELRWAVGLEAGEGNSPGRPGQVEVRYAVALQGAEPLLRVSLEIENRARNHRLRLRLPTGVRGAPARAGTHFGSLLRPAQPAAPAGGEETPVSTAPAHRWIAVAQGDRGLAVLVPGFVEYEWTAAGSLYLTLLRAVGELSRDDLPPRPGHAGWPSPTPGAQCLGTWRLELAIAPLTERQLDDPAWLERLWEDAFVPVEPLWIRDYSPRLGSPEAAFGGTIALEGAGLVVSTIKPAEQGDALVLRCYNAGGESVRGSWRFGTPVREAHQVRADETPVGPLEPSDGGTRVAFTAGPQEVVTVLVRQ
jgi:alpha-mannosidase